MVAQLFLDGYPVHLIPHLNHRLVGILLNTPRDQFGRVKVRDKIDPKAAAFDGSPFAVFQRMWRDFGLADHRIEKEWAILQKYEAANPPKG